MSSKPNPPPKPSTSAPTTAPAPTPNPPQQSISLSTPSNVTPSASPTNVSSTTSTSLVVTQQPEQPMAFTNYVYVSPEESQFIGSDNKETYIMLNNIAFIVKSHKDMKKGAVGMNRIQRESCGFSSDATVTAKLWVPPSDGSYSLLSLLLVVDVLSQGRKFQLDEEILIKFIKKNYINHVLALNQSIVCDINGVIVTFKVGNLEVPIAEETDAKIAQPGSITKFGKYGILLKSTDVEILSEKRNIEVKKIKRKKRPFDPKKTFVDMGIGGLDAEFGQIFRRAFASRFFPNEVITQLGIKHVKGMLLYGPPGTGKTLIARQIGKLLEGREPKVVNGPEILNKFVGASEENIRNLFKEAEEDYEENKDNSDLHIIIFDEIDAICKARGTVSTGTGVHDTVVNQLLSKIDGVKSLNNILVIGMTNRKDLIDTALLRPGRLEVHVEIGLPDQKGREQILMIHTKTMREHGRLAADVDIPKLAEKTKNFSGAEIEGLVKSASSYALYGAVDVSNANAKARVEEYDNIIVTMEQFERALEEIEPAFGIAEDELKNMITGDMIDYGSEFNELMDVGRLLIRQVTNSERTPLMTVLFEGMSGSGMTAVAATLAMESKFPYLKVISPENYIGMSEVAKCNSIAKIFEDAYKSPSSLILIDNIERLLEYVPIGPRFSNQVLQTLLVVMKRVPPTEGRKLMVFATTSSLRILGDMEMKQVFKVSQRVPQLSRPEHVKRVFESLQVGIEKDQLESISKDCIPIGIKQLIETIEMAKQADSKVAYDRFMQCLSTKGLGKKRSNHSSNNDNGDNDDFKM